MLPELPETYYLDNVVKLFDYIESLYADILEQNHLDFLRNFSALSGDGKKLYIRLLNRSHHLFRLSKLDYPEIELIEDAIHGLESRQFLLVNPSIENAERIALFNKAELLALHPEPKSLYALKRDELESRLLDQANETFLSALSQADHLIQVLQKDTYLLFQMLFFGNLNQSMTDFVLRDLGLNQFENYSIDSENRPYSSKIDIKQHWLLYKIDSLRQMLEPDDIDTLETCFSSIPGDIHQGSPLFRKSERIKYEIARQFERLGHQTLAMERYQQCLLPPSRERIVRLLSQQGGIEVALGLCETIVGKPFDDSELQFALEFGTRLAKRHKINSHTLFTNSSNNHRPDLIELELLWQDSVEQVVVDYFHTENEDNHCYYLENSLFTGVLGLLIWDVVFAPIPAAFYHPFQHRPADFYAHDFVHKRTTQMAQVWSSMSSNEEILQQATHRWQEKQNLMNPLVNWQALNLEIIQLALQRIPYQHWMAIFERILLDLRNNRAGFPDLVLFPASGGYLLVEVKGPGDTLQKNQQRWMQYFSTHNIPHALARVSWADVA